MYRNIILEFLTNKHLVLSDNGYYQMTLCELGRKYNDTPLKFVKKEDEINVYHVKEPRIYQKSYDFSKAESTVLMMLLELKSEITFNKSDLNFEMYDPYYLNDLRNQDFSSIQITPINDNDDIIGAVIVYYKKENSQVKFTNNELLKLLNNLKLDEEKEYLNSITDKFVKFNDYYFLCVKNNNVYLNDLLMKKLRFDTSVINIKSRENHKKVYSFINKHGIKKIKIDDLALYYIEKEKTSKVKYDGELYAMHNINNHNIGDDFSYLLVRKSPLTSLSNTLDNIVSWLNGFDDINYKIYQYNEETIIVIINLFILNSQIEHLKNILEDDYFILLSSSKDITNKMDLKKISDFIYSVHPEKFDYQEYVHYLTTIGNESLSYLGELKFDDSFYEIVNVDKVNSIGKMYSLPLRENLRNTHFKSYSDNVLKHISYMTKIEEDKIMINIPFSLLQKRKTLEDIKKIISNNNQLTINVIYDNNALCDEFIKVIAKYKKLNILLCCDSSVYLNFYLMPSIELFDSIYVQYEEYNHIRSRSVGMPQAIFSYVLHEYKNLIIENFEENEDLDFIHPNCYYVKKIKK